MTAINETASSSIDLFADATILDPYPLYAELREAGPVVWLTRHNAWVVGGYDLVKEVLNDWERFSSYPNPGLEPERPGMPVGGILGSDPPDHTRLRRLLARLTSPRAIRNLKADIEAQADQHIADLVARGSVDVVADLAQPFPLKVVSDLIGLPADGRENLLTLADAAFNSFGPANERSLAALPVLPQIFLYTATAMSRERIAPGSWGAAIYEAADEGLVTEDEAFMLLAGIVVAAMDTTIHALGSAVWLLAAHPEAWRALRADPELAGRVFEEVLRFESPVYFFARGATQDTVLGGTPIRAGDRVITLLGAANRDERHFPGADRFDLNRTPNDHVAFGHGIHSCGGQGVARLEGAAVLASLARRVERIEVVGEPKRHSNNTVRGLASLPVTLVGAKD